MMETYHGHVRTPTDAIKLFEACRLGMLPRVQRRLSEKERQSIRSGSVFVWDEREAGMRRWTDGKSWSASRVSGSFLTYREMEGKRGNGFGGGRRGAGKTPDSGRGSDDDPDDGEPDGYRYKADGLMKQSFSITTSAGQHLHLISYYSRHQPGQPDLMQPTADPNLRTVVPLKGMYPESSMNETPMPAMTRTPMQPVYPPQQMAPHQGYPSQYAQTGYSWPPSPVATPPYSHGHYTTVPYPPHPQQQIPPPPPHAVHHQPYPMHPHYAAHAPNPHYEQRAPLPPPQPTQPAGILAKTSAPLPHPQMHPQLQHQMQQQLPPYAHVTHHSPQLAQLAQPRGAGLGSPRAPLAQPRLPGLDSPRAQQLQAQAREAVQIDPVLAAHNTHARNLSGPQLPPLSQPLAPMSTPPSRALSVSPPRSTHSDTNGVVNVNVSNPGGNKGSLLAILHPTPSTSEPSSANPGSNSAGSSPRTSAAMASLLNPIAGQKRMQATEDARAIGALDKKLCI